ncbi:MAG TPA: N-acetylornithine carbamoyltransferase [Blastocatellia bacterium]|jgi:N-acetylornithine carbamoyltransferase|nr:N-acetylornithine carbamoyltransferase [Blastocatellia bacterium]
MDIQGKDFLSTADFTREQLASLVDLAAKIKAKDYSERPLDGRSVALVFFNPSLRTRASMEIAVYELGGNAVTLDVGKGTWSLEHREGVVMDGDKTEHVKEAARVLSRYVAAIGVRAFPEMRNYEEEMADPVLRGFAEHSDVPVLNLESSRHHPFQALADIMTIREKLGPLSCDKVTLTWAFHPKPLPMAVPNSFALIAAQFGLDLTIACPPEYDLGDEAMAEIRAGAEASGGRVRVSRDQREACAGARIVYAKSWGGKQFYGRPEQDLQTREQYRDWRVDEGVMRSTDDGYFMHCLPVRRNVVVTDGVLDGARNAAIDEAENRLHAQKAVLASIL